MLLRVVVTMVTPVPSAPVTVAVQVNGSGYASDLFRDLVASFDVLQGGNITVISRKCLLEPSEPDHATYFILGKRTQDVTSSTGSTRYQNHTKVEVLKHQRAVVLNISTA